MHKTLLFIAILCAFSSASALTPFDIDLSRVKSCKLKFSLKNGETLMTSVVALDEKGQQIAEFGDKRGNAFEETSDLREAEAYLIKNNICSEIKKF